MTKCTCKKLDCDSECLCNCHREEPDEGLDKAIDLCIERMQKFNLKKQVNQ